MRKYFYFFKKGLRFQNLDDEIEFLVKIEDMCEKIAQTKEAKKEEADLARCVGVNLNCVSLIRNNNALCFCTEFDYIYAFLVPFSLSLFSFFFLSVEYLFSLCLNHTKPLLEAAFDRYLSDPTEQSVKEIFDQINSKSLQTPPFSLNFTLSSKSIKFQVPKLVVTDQIWPVRFLCPFFIILQSLIFSFAKIVKF